MTKEGILSAIGNTPLVKLSRIFANEKLELFAKLEAQNPGGSIKDRPAVSMINYGLTTGEIRPETVIIESSSGNLGIGLAQVCSYHGLRFICVVDPKTTSQNIRLLQAYGAEVDIVSEPDPVTGEFLRARINRVHALRRMIKHSFWPNQYANINNPMAHHKTMAEIVEALDKKVDYLFCATSTCGTLRGCAEYLRSHGLKTKIIAVDAEGSVIFSDKKARRLIPGHGASVRPHLYQSDLAYEYILISDLDCIVGCRRLVRQEAILAGGSSGAVLMAIDRVKSSLPRDAVCVAIFPDRGERYLDTIYSDDWVKEHFGEVAYLWQNSKSAEGAQLWKAIAY
jgi:2,3-diaminopropionate biosynthesis protein SbnA